MKGDIIRNRENNFEHYDDVDFFVPSVVELYIVSIFLAFYHMLPLVGNS